MGELETYNAIRQHYWWPGLHTFAKNYVQGCGVCQQFKIDRHPSKPAFLPTEGAKSTRPFANCSMDLITDLPLSDGDALRSLYARANKNKQYHKGALYI